VIDTKFCCVCGHGLPAHIDEGCGWRCHSLGPDGFQCECYLRKIRGEGGKNFYSLARRVAEMKKELEELEREREKRLKRRLKP